LEELRPGDRFDEFEVIRKLDSGSFSEVYLAHDTILDRVVVLKQLSPNLSEDDSEWDAFISEARMTASFFHPGLITVHALRVDVHVPSVVLVLEYMDGGTLRHILNQQGRLSLDQVWNLTYQIGNALHYLHKRGIIHRDIKPENILYSQATDWYKLSDFGLAYNPDTPELEALNEGQPGTLLYMSPEQVMSEVIDDRSDQYTFAAVLYEALTGQYYLPVTPTDLEREELISHIRHNYPNALPMVHRDGMLVGLLEDVLMKALAKDPEDRYNNIARFTRNFTRTIEYMQTAPDVRQTQNHRPSGSDGNRPDPYPKHSDDEYRWR
jgi:serine/threonine-protein kinase